MYHPVSMHMKRVRVVRDPESLDPLQNGVEEKSPVEIITPLTEDSEEPNDQLAPSSAAKPSQPASKPDKESEQPLLVEHSGRKLSAGFRRSNINLDNYNVVRKISSSSFAGRMHNVGSSSQINRKTSAYASPYNVGSTGQMT
ncbi:unnamed protein product, partial [Nesidiocoris tenuis]